MIHFSPAQSAGAFLPPGHSFPPHAQSAHMQTQNMHMQSLYAAPQQFDINQLQSPTAQMQQQQQQQQQAQQQHLQLQMQWQHLQQQQAQLQQQQQIMAAQTTGQGQQMQQTQQQQLLQQQTAPSSVTPLTSQQLASSVQQLPLASQPQLQPGALKADQLSYYPSAQTLSYSQFSFSPSAPGLYTSLNGSGAPIHPYYPFAQNGGMQTQQQTVGLPPVKLMSLTSPTNAGAMSAAATPLISSLSSTPATTSTGMTTLISMAPAPLSPSNGAPNALVQSDHKRKYSGSSHDSASPTPADSQCDQQSSAVTRALPKAKTTDASDVHKSSVQHRRSSYTSASPPVINVTQQQQQQQLSQAPHASQLTSPPTTSSASAIPPHIGNHAQLRRYKHKEVEVRRRRKISTLFAELASLLECGPTDKASLLSIATKYIRRAKAKGVRPQSVEEGEEEDSDATDEGAATPAASAPATSTGAAAASRPRSSSISQTQPLPHRPLDVATSSSLRLPAASLNGAPAALVSLAASPSRPSSAPSSASSSVAQSPLPLQASAATTAANAAAAQVKIETTSKQSSEQ